MKWISSFRQKPIKYINVGDSANFLGWDKPRKGVQYVSLDSAGKIEYYYNHINGSWRKTDTNGVESFLPKGLINYSVKVNNPDNDGGTFSSNITISPDADVEYTINTLQSSTEYSFTCNTKGQNIPWTLNLTAQPKSGYEFVKWVVDSDDVDDLTLTVNNESEFTSATPVFKESGGSLKFNFSILIKGEPIHSPFDENLKITSGKYTSIKKTDVEGVYEVETKDVLEETAITFEMLEFPIESWMLNDKKVETNDPQIMIITLNDLYNGGKESVIDIIIV